MHDIQFPVIWSDESLMVINKPAGILTIPDGYDPELPHLKKLLAAQYGQLWIVHRLDRDTSGVIVLARSASAHRSLNTQFQNRQVVKIYHALVEGNPDWEQRTVDLPLKVNVGRRHRTVVDRQAGKASLTGLKVLERFGSYCLMEAAPQSGRRHQIRAHLAVLGLPIVGDDLYGSDAQLPTSKLDSFTAGGEISDNLLLSRIGLHAMSIEFMHPVNHQISQFTAPYPEDFINSLIISRELRG